MVLQIDFGFVSLILIFAVVMTVRFLLVRKTRRKSLKHYYEALQEKENFLKTFNVIPFDDFSAFDFRPGRLSHVSPFPRLVEGEWRYGIYLSRSGIEDITTIAHEISECTLGRVIEGLFNLDKPLYLQRKEDDRFWVHGKKQKYLVEHVMTTLGEVGDLAHEKLKQRLDKEEAKTWLNLET